MKNEHKEGSTSEELLKYGRNLTEEARMVNLIQLLVGMKK